MAHFVSNIHNYIMVEVVESSWKIFLDEVKHIKNLDDLIETPFNFDNDVLLSDSIIPSLELTPLVLEPVIPYTFVATQVPESHTAFAFAFLPLIFVRRRR